MLDIFNLSLLFSLEGTPCTLAVPTAPSASALQFLEQIHRRKSDGLKALIAREGWPTERSAGDHMACAAFMIVSHADYDPELQLACHALMLKAAHQNDIKLGFLAFLTDRILVNNRQLQRFGTQVREVANGCFVPKPLEDPDNIDTLRERVQLQETLSDYLQRVNEGDFLFYRPLMGDYAEELEHIKENKVLPFPFSPTK
jgi:hypothetical protein